ncbi:MAG: LysM peptidoglycan-binding domain-containing protein, partial [Muribaculaceae bacterium]|nr:LysM peptidoglycan-binding domain-containing protein [Muribaculaceae bacterium]
MKRVIFAFIAIILSLSATMASAKTEHTVERGETLTSIAQRYNVSTDALLNANPYAKEMFYTGMVLIIPESETQTSVKQSTSQPAHQSTYIASQNYESYQPVSHNTEVAPNVNGWFVSYNAPFDHFDHGFYGIGFQMFSSSGFGATFSAHGNWGLVDPGNLMFKFGPAYAIQIHENVALSASLRGFIYTYDKLKKNGKGTDQKVNGGIT